MAENEVEYVKFTSAMADADYGKIRAGQVLALDSARAARFRKVGAATASSEAEYNDYREQRVEEIEQETSRAGDFADLNRASAADWDVSMTRDATMAPEEGIKRAFEQGRLVNTDRLRDADGKPLPADPSLDQILEARAHHGFQESELTRHDRSSVQGGGSHLVTGVRQDVQEFSTLEGRAPLNSPSHKLTREQLGNGPEAEGKGKPKPNRPVTGNEAAAPNTGSGNREDSTPESGAKGANAKK